MTDIYRHAQIMYCELKQTGHFS